jgi:hypothetical protein
MADWQFEADEGRGGGEGAKWMQKALQRTGGAWIRVLFSSR